MSYIKDKNHILFRSSDDIKQICKPLKQYYGIETFSYLRINPDLSRIHLDTNTEWNEHFYKHVKRYNEDGLTEASHWDNGTELLSSLSEEACRNEAYHFNIGDGIVISNHTNQHTELAYFALKPDANNSQLLKLINEQDTLKLFIDYFKEKAKSLISEANKSPIVLPFLTPSETVNIFDSLQTQRLFLKELNKKNRVKDSLTKRELQCLYWKSMGKTIEEIAIILSISERTVKAHMLSSKNKLDSINQFQLGMAYNQLV